MAGENPTTIYDTLIALIRYGVTILGVVIGIFLGKWIEERNENKKLKREIYLKATKALNRYTDFYIGLAAYPGQNGLKQLPQENILLEEAKAGIEIFGSDKANEVYQKCLKLAVKCGREAIEKRRRGQPPINPARDLDSYNDFLEEKRKWKIITRKDLNLELQSKV